MIVISTYLGKSSAEKIALAKSVAQKLIAHYWRKLISFVQIWLEPRLFSGAAMPKAVGPTAGGD